MGEPASVHKMYRFGVFELDTAAFELRKDGKAEPRLREQTLQVLLMLLEHPREIVTREEIQKRLWSSDTFVDFDQGLNTAINQLRNALGDSAASPRFIQTLPRRGYRFIAPVNIVPVADAVIGARSVAPDPAPLAAAAPSDPAPAKNSLLSDPDDLPGASRSTVRLLFSAIQVLYLVFYVVSLARLNALDAILAASRYPARAILILVIVTAVVGIPTRLYLLSAALFNYRHLAAKFLRLFPFLFPLDELWSLAPFLIVNLIGIGSALAATAALLYLPFAQRSLLLMGFPALPSSPKNER